jgi:ferredoxin
MNADQEKRLSKIKEKFDLIEGSEISSIDVDSTRIITLNKPDGTNVSANVNILQLEDMDKKIEYHCNDGFCGQCQCKLLKGIVAQPKDILASVRTGNFLACKSKILSKNIEFESNIEI